MKRFLWWFAINGTLAASLYFGFIEGVSGAQNIALAIAWYTLAVSFAALHDSVQISMAEQGLVVPRWIETLFDMSVIGVLIWHAAWLTGVGYLIRTFVMAIAWDRALKLKAKNE